MTTRKKTTHNQVQYDEMLGMEKLKVITYTCFCL